MTAKMDERTKEVLQKYLPENYPKTDAVWPLERGGKVVAWIAKHKALEVIAAHNNIAFDKPMIVQSDISNKSVAIVVSGKLGSKVEWSIGEAAPYNNKNDYPYAMAEKRAKDRVILKLLGLHGDVYSEEEADDFKDAPVNNALKNDPAIQADMANLGYDPAKVADDMIGKIQLASDLVELKKIKSDNVRYINTLPESYKQQVIGEYNSQFETFKQLETTGMTA